MTEPESASELSTQEQRRAEAAQWFERWRERAQAVQLPSARELTDEDVNALVHELR